MHVKDESVINLTVTPSDATYKEVAWSSKDTSIATVENGKVIAKAVGTTVITAKTSDGKSAECNVDVTEITEEEYKAMCSTYTYKQLARNPEDFKGKYVKLTGEVVQVIPGSISTAFRVDITKNGKYSTYYTDTIYATYYPEVGESKILENDIITIWGTAQGEISYKSVLGVEINLPNVFANYIEIN